MGDFIYLFGLFSVAANLFLVQRGPSVPPKWQSLTFVRWNTPVV